jgi:uncharacterized RDD family membrane protein YckC
MTQPPPTPGEQPDQPDPFGGSAMPPPMPPGPPAGAPYNPTPPGPPPGAYPGAPPVAPGYGYGAPGAVPAGMYFDRASGLMLPNGVQLASVGRRIGAYFLAIPLLIVTLVIGYIIWGLVLWGRGTSPALKVLGMKVWKPSEQRVGSFGTMALRDIVGMIVQGILSVITLLISFILFLSGKEHKTLPDHIAGTVVVYDPNKVLG